MCHVIITSLAQQVRRCSNKYEKKSISISFKKLLCGGLYIGQLPLSQVLSLLALSCSHTPATAPLCLSCPSTPLPLPHIKQAHPQDHPLPLLSTVQSLLTELSPDGKRERKELSAALSQPERSSPPTAAWLTGLYCVSSGGEWCHEIVDVHIESGSGGLRFEWPQRVLD